MEWTPGDMNGDVEDRRNDSGGGGGGGFGGGGIGIIGFVVLLLVSVITGRNYLGAFLHGGSEPTQQVQPASGPPASSAADGDRDAHLVVFTLHDVQNTWTSIFSQEGRTYRHATLVLYRGATYSGCGTAQSRPAPSTARKIRRFTSTSTSGTICAASAVVQPISLRPT